MLPRLHNKRRSRVRCLANEPAPAAVDARNHSRSWREPLKSETASDLGQPRAHAREADAERSSTSSSFQRNADAIVGNDQMSGKAPEREDDTDTFRTGMTMNVRQSFLGDPVQRPRAASTIGTASPSIWNELLDRSADQAPRQGPLVRR